MLRAPIGLAPRTLGLALSSATRRSVSSSVAVSAHNREALAPVEVDGLAMFDVGAALLAEGCHPGAFLRGGALVRATLPAIRDLFLSNTPDATGRRSPSPPLVADGRWLEDHFGPTRALGALPAGSTAGGGISGLVGWDVALDGLLAAGELLRLQQASYSRSHFDSVIHHYRETIVRALGRRLDRGDADVAPGPDVSQRDRQLEALARIERIMHQTIVRSFAPGDSLAHMAEGNFLPLHTLDLRADGHIQPHVDNLSASGRLVAGVSLLSGRVVRFEQMYTDARPRESVKPSERRVLDVLLPPGSFYMQRDKLRYDYTHAILPVTPGQETVWPEGAGQRVVPLEPARRIVFLVRDRLNATGPGPGVGAGGKVLEGTY
ncbi:hypothetical protein H696_00080 [Fonticula alba]|uniref:Alpha-ketoglutarate-dependent dioxygenase AlkB-like domain-containing protein n=1 Tax=Fonticula alba TaxID=691883 RepID=A0A058ZDL8_FONAL|nr:hypothetical protein H696_00080 [Fonticula alba]KCV72485.1 hypothetical protein H696_00080 [Fonticula alba]|eukprot:XP_009492186.1 hypothetical protein H696_00080 [Fonticula alba]